MHKVKQFMNKITDKQGTADPSTGSVQTLDTDGDGQVSAEGFLCPDCMTAFPNPETLAEHYTTKHTDAASSETTSELDDNALYNLALEHDELLELRAALETERQQSLDMQRELVTLRKESTSRKASVASSRSHNDEAENMLREECTNLRKQTDEWKSNFNKVNSEMETLKETTTDRIQILNESLKTLKEELSHIQNKAALSEGECRDLRLEAQRLREQHSELVSRVEGDEGTQAAIESLAKERDTLTLNLDTTQVQNRELSKNLYNIGLELEKLRNEHALITSQFNEYKKKAEAAAAEQTKELAEKVTLLETDRKTIDESRTSIKLLEKQLKEQSSKLHEQKTKMVHSDELIANLEKTAASRDQEINQLNLLVESLRKEMRSAEEKSIAAEKTIDEFQNAIQTKVEKIKILETENSSLRTANENVQSVLTKQKEVFTNHLTDVNAFLGITESEYDTNQSGIETYKQRSNLVLTGMADKINGIKQIQQSVQRQLDAMNQELGSSKAEIEILADRNKKLTEEMKSQKETNAAEFESLQKELIENRTSFEHKLKSAKKFEEQVAKLEEEMTVVRNDSKRFQDERDNLQAERLELDKKYKSSEEARTLLLDRCLAGESETEKFNETIQGLQRKLADALAALQELGRENQSLQVESAKLQGRKWTDDSNVNNCSTCSKEFSITVRKHHCRVCGNIFCHECSSKTASIPSSKKPVRVCDACADELLK